MTSLDDLYTYRDELRQELRETRSRPGVPANYPTVTCIRGLLKDRLADIERQIAEEEAWNQ